MDDYWIDEEQEYDDAIADLKYEEALDEELTSELKKRYE